MPSLIDLTLEGRKVGQYGRWPRVAVDASVWTFAASELAHGRWSLLGLWGEPATVHMAIMLVFGLLLAFGALTLRLTSVAFGEPRGSTAPADASYIPMFAHLALVLGAGIYLPAPLVVWFQHVAQLLG